MQSSTARAAAVLLRSNWQVRQRAAKPRHHPAGVCASRAPDVCHTMLTTKQASPAGPCQTTRAMSAVSQQQQQLLAQRMRAATRMLRAALARMPMWALPSLKHTPIVLHIVPMNCMPLRLPPRTGYQRPRIQRLRHGRPRRRCHHFPMTSLRVGPAAISVSTTPELMVSPPGTALYPQSPTRQALVPLLTLITTRWSSEVHVSTQLRLHTAPPRLLTSTLTYIYKSHFFPLLYISTSQFYLCATYYEQIATCDATCPPTPSTTLTTTKLPYLLSHPSPQQILRSPETASPLPLVLKRVLRFLSTVNPFFGRRRGCGSIDTP